MAGIPTSYDLNLDLVGNSILVQIQSDFGGTISAALFSGPAQSYLPANYLTFNATFSGSPSYQDVLIPLTDAVVSGTGTNLTDVSAVDLYLGLNTAGGTWSIDGVAAVPEPSTLLLTGICLLVIVVRPYFHKVAGPH